MVKGQYRRVQRQSPPIHQSDFTPDRNSALYPAHHGFKGDPLAALEPLGSRPKQHTRMPIQSLPSEIVLAIIESIPLKNDLSSISLTSTYFLSLARPILFSNILFPRVPWREVSRTRRPAESLEPSARNESCDPSSYTDLVFFLTSTPQLAFFIHSLTLWGNPPEADVLAVAPMEVEVFNGILSALPSLRTLCLHNVKFTSSNIAVPYRYDSINRLILSSTTQPYDVMKPLAFFSHIHELELELARSWERPALTPLSFEEICLWWHISNIVPTHVQVSSIHLKGPFYRPTILEMFR